MPHLRPSLTRRSLVSGLAVLGSLQFVQAQEADSTPEQVPIESTTTGAMPSSGALRPGPVGETSPLPRASRPSVPVRIVVEIAGVDASIEQQNIVDGVMSTPSGPWVVAWYPQTATLGEQGNVVLAGHVDFWGVGPSVFFNISKLQPGDEIVLTGEEGREYVYAVEWSKAFTLEELTDGGKLAEVSGPTDTRSLTLITCGGDFDYVNGEYLSRQVVRAAFVPPPPATPEGTPAN